MKTRRILVPALVAISTFWLSTGALAQGDRPTEMLSGRVVVRDDGLPAPQTRIWIFEANGPGHYTAQQNTKGEFSISLPEGYYFVFVGQLGCIPYAKEIWLKHGEPIKLMVYLDLDLAIMQGIHVKWR